MKNRIIFSILLVISGVFTYNYLYQNHRNIGTEQPDFIITPQNIIDVFKVNAVSSEKKYLNKTIEISGIVTEVNKNDLTLNHTIFCQFSKSHALKINSEITLKGRFIGYDDLFEQIKLDQCSITND